MRPTLLGAAIALVAGVVVATPADAANPIITSIYTANQRDKAAAAAAGHPGSNNFSTINSTVQFRLYSSVLRNYPNQWMTAEDYKKLLYWNVWSQYVGGNTQWPDANEFWADWNGGNIQYRSWIHHNILGSGNWTTIEDVAGLRPRTDGLIELSPINIGWSHFAVDNRLHFRDDRAGNRYRAPSSYQVQYWNGSGWADVPGLSRTPASPRANYNLAQFTPVSTQRLRVRMTHVNGFRTGLTEIKVY